VSELIPRAVIVSLVLSGPALGSSQDAAQTDQPATAASSHSESCGAIWAAAVDAATPERYAYEELRRCAGCHEASRDASGHTTHQNAIGLAGQPETPVLTGKGWLSGGHGRSQDAEIVSNTHCAWCHAPSQPGVTSDIGEARKIVTGRVGVSCIACHASEAVNERFGHYQANFRPGGDRESLVDFVRNPKDGIETNDQCLFCHLQPHAFSVAAHTDLLRDGALRCIDCHMAVYNVTDGGIAERYHNLEVAANEDPAACQPCHDFQADEIAAMCAELISPQSSRAHAVPPFE